MKALSTRQRHILSFLREFIEDKDYPPTVRDIQRGCSISSTSVVAHNLKALEQEGYIRRDPEISRGIELLGREGWRRRLIKVPVIGSIAAGEPIPVPSPDTWSTVGTGDFIALAEEMTRGKQEVYALRVKGTSMVDALIDDGDIVLMQQVSTADNGDMVAAWLKEEREVTLKRFYQEPGRVRLQPANQQMQPIYVAPENVEIQGRVIGVIRSLA